MYCICARVSTNNRRVRRPSSRTGWIDSRQDQTTRQTALTLTMDYQPSPRRLSSSTCSIASNSSWTSHDECPPLTTSRRCSIRFFTYQHDRKPSTSPSSASSRSCEGMSQKETRELWRCMLHLQQRYGCYNSTRIDLAVNAGEAGIDLMRKWCCCCFHVIPLESWMRCDGLES